MFCEKKQSFCRFVRQADSSKKKLPHFIETAFGD